MKDQEFRAWLEQGGARSQNALNSRVQAVRKIEANLAKIGVPYDNLDEVYKAGKFDLLHQRLEEIHKDFKAGGQKFKILMPKSTTTDRLSSWRSYIGRYERFLSGEPPGRDQYADRIREYVLREIISPSRQRGEAYVDILVSDVNSALGLPDAAPSICSALTGKIFHKMAEVSPPDHIAGAKESSAAVFRFHLQGANANEETESNDLATDNDGGKKMHPTNLILYGPPGTGKTYATAEKAVEICLGDAPQDRADLLEAYKQLMADGRIEFVTFHQSMSYEDFVEGRQPMTGSDDDAETSSAGFRLETVPGIFRKIAKHAEISRGSSSGDGISLENRQLFKMSIGRKGTREGEDFFEEAIEGGYTMMGGSKDIDWSDARFSDANEILKECQEKEPEKATSLSSGRVNHIDILRNKLQIGDILVVSKGNKRFRAIGEVTGDYEYIQHSGNYNHRRSVNWLWHDADGVPVNEICKKNFSQKTIYDLRQAEPRIANIERYINSERLEASGEPENFVLIIDEINRANISKVLGELITLLEPDKRLNQENELKVRLPYSGDMFGVPANLHIIGTMNTADRSIALLDTALRRRFEFREVMPDPSLLKDKTIDGVDLQLLLTTINERIEYLYDREHQIGHAYFMGCETREDIDDVMRHKVIPLLAEYFYEDWSKVAAVLGDSQEGEGEATGGFLDRTPLKAPPGLDEGEMAPRFRWKVRPTFDYGKLAGQ